MSSSPASLLDIAEVTARTGLAASTLRHWESQGLIQPAGRKGLRRQYRTATLNKIAHIRLAQAAGFTLREIGTWIGPNDHIKIDRIALHAKADELDDVIRRLQAMRDGLRHCAECPAPDHSECATFKALLRKALAGQLGEASPAQGFSLA